MPLILVLSLIVSGIFTAFKAVSLSWLRIFPLSFIVCFIALSLMFWLVIYLSCFYIPVGREYDKPSKFHLAMINAGYWFVCSYAGIRVKATGLDKVPKSGRFLFVSNHLSRFDNMIQCLKLRKTPIAFISKPSNFKIPIARHLMTRCCYIPIDRESPKNAAKSIARAEKLIANDIVSIGVFPQGHRGTGYDIGDFKAGCFKIAVKTGCPIVVATICGTEKVHKNFPFRRTVVNFDILEIIENPSGKTVDIAKTVKEIIQENLNKYKES